MARPSRGIALAGAAVLVALAVGVGVLARSGTDGTGPGVVDGRRASGVPARFTGEYGGGPLNVDLRPAAGLFATECAYSHSSDDDPIVYPGVPGAAHHHDFFGNTGTDAFSTADSLAEGPTTCRLHDDTTAYWAPALIDDGEYVEPISADAYYRTAPGIDPDDLEPYPMGFMMIAGDGHAETEQPTEIVAWACDRSRKVSVTPPECPETNHLTMRVTFPDCWNGVDVDSDDHKVHVTYSTADGCPESHPVPIPVLTFVVHYPVHGPPGRFDLSPGTILQGHADFFNAWAPEKLEREIDHCLRRGLVCAPPGGTGGSPPLF